MAFAPTLSNSYVDPARPRAVGGWILPSVAVMGLSTVLASAAAESPTPFSYRETLRPLLETHCFECHADGAKKGNVAFDRFATDEELLADTGLWHRVLKNVRAGLMPPPESDQPSAEQRAQVQQWIKDGIFQLDPARPDPGRPMLRRLNRTEYQNTIRDLTGVDFPAEEEFPADDTGHGFDNIGEVLTVSPMLMEKYLTAARTIMLQAVPRKSRLMPEKRLEGDQFFTQAAAGAPDARGPQRNRLSYYEPVTLAAAVDIPHSGKYSLTFELCGHEKYVEGESDLNRCRLVFRADGEELGSREFAHAAGKKFQLDFARDWSAGEHQVTVELERLTPDEKPVRSLALNVDRLIVRGPTDPAHWNEPPNYRRWFPRPVPENADERRAYARERLESFAARAFRRPLTDNTADRLAALAESIWSQPGESFESGVVRAMEAVLASPRFIFREEFTEPDTDSHAHPLLDEFSLASRLSYLLWSTMPDDELLQLAGSGRLRAEFDAQFQRMMADDRSRAFFKNFVGQWLQARDIEGVPIDAPFVLLREQKPDPEAEQARARFLELRRKPDDALTGPEREEMERVRTIFRRSFGRFRDAEFRNDLRRDMRRETEMYFENLFRDNRPLTELIDSDYAFLNERLAKHYGVPGVSGDTLQKVVLPPDSPRGGMLTQGTMLAVTSNPTRTSPVKRGLFILDNILGTPPPPPPANVPPLEEANGRGQSAEGTLRVTLEKHRADPKCASCHNRMDPLGFAFEHFNAMGQWREFERGQPIDAGGQLVSGESFASARELKKILVTRHREPFYRCFIEKLMIYALGRGLDHHDETTIDQLLDALNRADGRPLPLLQSVVKSDAFQRRQRSESRGQTEKLGAQTLQDAAPAGEHAESAENGGGK